MSTGRTSFIMQNLELWRSMGWMMFAGTQGVCEYQQFPSIVCHLVPHHSRRIGILTSTFNRIFRAVWRLPTHQPDSLGMGQEWTWNSCFDGTSGLQDGGEFHYFQKHQRCTALPSEILFFFLGFVPIVLGSHAHLFKVLGSIVVGLLCALAAVSLGWFFQRVTKIRYCR